VPYQPARDAGTNPKRHVLLKQAVWDSSNCFLSGYSLVVGVCQVLLNLYTLVNLNSRLQASPAASHFREKSVSEISFTVQCIQQVLRS
jgi:hypothetical protein